MIGIVDYGMGNLLSVRHALEWLGAEVKICDTPSDLTETDKIILPGVGSFSACMKNLSDKGFVQSLNLEVLSKKKPILGICLGMQAMADRGYEGGETAGLGWISGEVRRLEPENNKLRIPHIGWQEIQSSSNPLFTEVPKHSDFYFVHSFHFKCQNPNHVIATCDYGGPFTAAIGKEHIFATQFHPEKSQGPGLKVLENFLKWKHS